MATPFIGEIRMFGFNFPPRGWALCNGQTLAISQNQALFSILGTTYGGNGQTTFQLPNLQGRTPVHTGNEIVLGQAAGEINHTLIASEIPAHNHPVNASAGAVTGGSPTGSYLTSQLSDPMFASASSINGSMAPLQPAGGSQPHNNMQPYTVVSICVALTGVFPSRN